ncbi:MAG TPA: hypothetical protein VFM24_00865 [Nitrospira sp.]|nr:hypothetical protein [Nitrospira sp.]
MRASVRYITALVVIAIGIFAIGRGWQIVSFSLAMAGQQTAEERHAIVTHWGTTPGLASTALRTALADRIDLADQKAANRQREALIAILSIKPVSAREWMSLSAVQLITDQSMDDVLESLKMSTLTGPNEGSVMVERGVYGVSLWEQLSPDLKSRVATDLIPTLFPRTPGEGQEGGKLRALVSAQSERVRRELKQALLASGVSAGDLEQRLGL